MTTIVFNQSYSKPKNTFRLGFKNYNGFKETDRIDQISRNINKVLNLFKKQQPKEEYLSVKMI